MDDWIDRAADALGEGSLGPDEIGIVLRLARDVAHGVERKMAPLAAFLVGAAVGRAPAEARPEALRAAAAALEPLLRAPGDGPV